MRNCGTTQVRKHTRAVGAAANLAFLDDAKYNYGISTTARFLSHRSLADSIMHIWNVWYHVHDTDATTVGLTYSTDAEGPAIFDSRTLETPGRKHASIEIARQDFNERPTVNLVPFVVTDNDLNRGPKLNIAETLPSKPPVEERQWMFENAGHAEGKGLADRMICSIREGVCQILPSVTIDNKHSYNPKQEKKLPEFYISMSSDLSVGRSGQ
ncbi:hypothetical protein JAAARDRAFT_693331 [Jaapia argillacea MUCL 33604]|uniref:Uncharacterized protein n=1 Tax=Jaapia argillacea MUCL 33604 TaxID=933084 RepID=A0A067PIY7_9AGAM|nr:hypothetical protein JAAARDRAFT_693331 [Jaapia argillacea MUCL 33604]